MFREYTLFKKIYKIVPYFCLDVKVAKNQGEESEVAFVVHPLQDLKGLRSASQGYQILARVTSCLRY